MAILGGVIIILLALPLGILGVARSSSLFAKLVGSEVKARVSSEQPAKPDELPRHPFEHMGIAGLSPSTGMPDDAIAEAQAIEIVIEYTWGPYRDELVKDYPVTVIPAIYNAQESVMGPAAEERPVWGWSSWNAGDQLVAVGCPVRPAPNALRPDPPRDLLLKENLCPA